MRTRKPRKLERVCEQLQLRADDHVLEIGCGWGGFALHAARTRGCRVTGLTISAEQARLARERVAAAGLSGSSPSRRTTACTTAAIRRSRRSRCSRRSASASSRPTSRRSTGARVERNRVRSDDPHPGRPVGPLSQISRLDRAVRVPRLPDPVAQRADQGGDRWVASDRARRARDRAALRRDAASLAPNFHERIDQVRALGYDRTFERTWDFYLAFCEAGFRTRALRDVQLTLSRPLNESVAF